ncbi:hypothetical protein ACQ4PT_032371 [Festuca glaucescens]
MLQFMAADARHAVGPTRGCATALGAYAGVGRLQRSPPKLPYASHGDHERHQPESHSRRASASHAEVALDGRPHLPRWDGVVDITLLRAWHAGAQCHSPDTLVAHCSYAANSYFHRISQADEDATCDFGGAAALSEIDPSSETCTYPASTTDDGTTASPPAASWCVCKPGLSNAALQGTLDYACGHGADCDALRPEGQCHDPDTLLAHCSYAANSYFQSSKDAACDFAGTATLSTTDPTVFPAGMSLADHA